MVTHHVALLVANDARSDIRVAKIARWVADAGFAVTVLAADPQAQRREESRLGNATIVRIPFGPAGPVANRDKARYLRRRARLKASERWFLALRYRAGAQRWRQMAGQVGYRGASLAGRVLERRFRRRREHRAGSRTAGSGSGPDLRGRAKGWSELVDLEVAFGGELDRLRPALVHANDVMTLGVAVRAAERSRGRGSQMRIVYDAHELVTGLDHLPRGVVAAYVQHETRYAPVADAVVTVSEPLADNLVRRLDLPARPTVVMNVPDGSNRTTDTSVRRACGLDESVPLAVYSGGLHASRGMETVVRALASVPDLHVAIVSRGGGTELARLQAIAVELGVADRLHPVPFVAPEEVVGYLADADIGLHPLLPTGNHEVALTNKLFDYLHAGLPILTSDLPASGGFVRDHRLGVVFEPGSVGGAAQGLTTLLADLGGFQERLMTSRSALVERYSWSAQVDRLLGVYAGVGVVPERKAAVAAPRPRGASDDRPSGRVGIGPRNMAGQAMAWARALRQAGMEAESFAIERPGRLSFEADLRIPRNSWTSLEWQLARTREVLRSFSHLLLESGTGALGTLNGGRLADDLPMLTSHGIRVAAVCHGSDIRDPRRHVELEPYSPFSDSSDGFVQRLQRSSDELREQLLAANVPVFITTLGLLDDAPNAHWLPVLVAAERLEALERRPPLASGRPRVLHLPSSGRLKGSAEVERALQPLAEAGHIELLLPEPVGPEHVPGLLATADIVVDGLLLGDYGVTAVEAMTMGRVVLGNVADRVRERLPGPLPIVQATPFDLAERVMELLEEPGAAAKTASDGPAFTTQYHSPRAVRQCLAGFLAS
jgi:glycosyltransferase involved in cell wall biosynthesis